MTEYVLLKDDDGNELGTVQTASYNGYTIFNISQLFGCIGVRPCYSTNVPGKHRADNGRLFADWISIKQYLENARKKTPLTIQMMRRADVRVSPPPVSFEFSKNPVQQLVESLPDEKKVLTLLNLGLFVRRDFQFSALVGEDIRMALAKIDFSYIMSFSMAHASEILLPAIKRLEEKKCKEGKKPIDVSVKDGKLCIQLEIHGINV